jgi:hypothetical protein
MIRHAFKVLPAIIFLSLTASSFGQEITVIAGKQYAKKESYQVLWGQHYRKEWTTPVKVQVVSLDTLAGGLKPYEKGGGRQTKTLRLHDKDKREYVLRSIDKSFGKALPEIYQGTFIEKLIDDQVSIGHPYSALTIPPLARAAGIYHTQPRVIYIPKQPALDSFNEDFGDELYLFEQRPDENWATAENFGFAENIIGTDKMLEELLEDHNHRIDQEMYVRSRLFDWVIGDWGRHEDQWRWAEFKDGDKKLFKPVPRDRDQAYTLFDGKFLKTFISMGGLDHLQSFDTAIQNIAAYNFPARNLDRRAANEMSLDKWISLARELQHSLTDQVIESAIKLLPPEIYSFSGPAIVTKIKARRNNLQSYARDYYSFLAQAVDVVGADDKELFRINRINDNDTRVTVLGINKKGTVGGPAVYDRVFHASETSEIRLYGMGKDDLFTIDGNVGSGILIRIIGGKGEDSLVNTSVVSGNRKLIQVYDDEDSKMKGSKETRLHIRNDKHLNNYEYKSFEYDKKGFGLKPGFFSLTFGYGATAEKWKKTPAGFDHSVKVKYSINRGAVQVEYNGLMYQQLGKWNLAFTAGAGVPKVVNFFGIGNDSKFETYNRSYFRLRSHEYYGKFGLNRNIGKHHIADIRAFYETVRIRPDVYRFITDYFPDGNGTYLDRKHFAGGEARYQFRHADDDIIPSKGFNFLAGATYSQNLSESSKSFTRVVADASAYLPFLKIFSLALRAGGATIEGDPEFYQLNILGSHDNLRGYRKYRFYGKQMFYHNQELRMIFNVRNKVFNGKSGLVGFYDRGRVWQPGEDSDTWHAGYGGGAFLSLFNKVILSLSYGISKEDKVTHAYFGFYF